MKTAVEWMVEKLFKPMDNPPIENVSDIIKQAKELEKKQIEDAFCEGVDDEYEHHINNKLRKNSEQYYNETFKNK